MLIVLQLATLILQLVLGFFHHLTRNAHTNEDKFATAMATFVCSFAFGTIVLVHHITSFIILALTMRVICTAATAISHEQI